MRTFIIDDEVWMPTYGRNRYRVPCPDCSGTRSIGIILPGGENYSIPCRGCSSGYDEPSGYIEEYVFETRVQQHIVTGVRISAHSPVEYELDGTPHGCTIGHSGAVFAIEAEARAQGEILKQEAEDRENKRVHSKLKNHRSWAWHVSYYRQELKRAQENVERFEKALGIAKEKAE